MNVPPKDVGKNGLTPNDEAEIAIIGLQKPIVFSIPSIQADGRKTNIIAAAYEGVRRNLKSAPLPVLLPTPPPSYELRDALGKGLGLFAKQNIAAGELILVERPVFFYPSLIIGANPVAIYEEIWNSLSPHARIAIKSLKNVKDRHVPSFMGTTGTNAFGISPPGGKEKYGGLFVVASRINHRSVTSLRSITQDAVLKKSVSCGPNTTQSFNPDLFVLCIQAVRPIAAGEEITLAYESLTIPRADRFFDLERKYKFFCTCQQCVNPSPDSDKNRKLYGLADFKSMRMDLQLSRIRFEKNRKKLYVKLIRKGLNILAKEGLEAGSYTIPYYHGLIEFYGSIGDQERMRYWGFKGLLLSAISLSSGQRITYRVDEWVDWLMDPQKNFPNWNSGNRNHSTVGTQLTPLCNLKL